jgi:hypothetical protein
MTRLLKLRVSALWLAAVPPFALCLLEPVRQGTTLSGLSGNALSAGEALALSAYLGAYLTAWLFTPTVLLSYGLRRAFELAVRARERRRALQ